MRQGMFVVLLSFIILVGIGSGAYAALPDTTDIPALHGDVLGTTTTALGEEALPATIEGQGGLNQTLILPMTAVY